MRQPYAKIADLLTQAQKLAKEEDAQMLSYLLEMARMEAIERGNSPKN